MGILSRLFGEKKPEVTEDVKVFTDLNHGNSVNDFFLAGVQRHCTRKDVGFFTGVVFNEKDNAYNKRAMAVGCHQTKKLVGYVPEAILDSFRDWCGGKDCPCVGYIFFDGEMLRGRVRAYHPGTEQDIAMKDIAEYAGKVCEHFGWQTPNFTT